MNGSNQSLCSSGKQVESCHFYRRHLINLQKIPNRTGSKLPVRGVVLNEVRKQNSVVSATSAIPILCNGKSNKRTITPLHTCDNRESTSRLRSNTNIKQKVVTSIDSISSSSSVNSCKLKFRPNKSKLSTLNEQQRNYSIESSGNLQESKLRNFNSSLIICNNSRSNPNCPAGRLNPSCGSVLIAESEKWPRVNLLDLTVYNKSLQQPSIELCATDIKNNADNLNLISNRKRLSTTRTINHNSERSSNSPNDPLLNTSDAEDISDLATISKSSTRANEYHITSQQCNVKAGSVDPTVVNHSSDQSLSLHTRPSSALSLKYMMSEKGGWGYTHSTMNASLLSRDRYNQKAVQTDLSICQNAIVMVMIPPAEMNKLSALQLHSFDHCCKPTPLITTSTQTEPTSNNKSTTLLNNTKGNKIRSAKSRDKRSLKCMHKVQSQFKHNIDRDSVFGIFDWMLQDWLHHRFNMTTHPMILASRHIYSSISLLSSSRILGNGFNNPDQISVTSSKSIVNNIIPSSPLHKAAKHLVRSRSIQCSIEPAHSSSLISSKVNSQIDNCKHEVNQFIDQTSTNLDRFLNKITVLKAYADSKAKCNQRQFKGYINQINAVYDNNLNGLSNDVNDKLDLLRVRIDRLQIKLGNIKANASNKSMLTFDMAITNTEPPSLLSKEVLEKEVESLRIALQFKFNELASLRTKHNDTINKLDELGELGDRFQSSQQRIEELQALLELRQQNEKVANKNLAQLRHSYDQKVHENNLLRSENDQLSFKLQQYLIRNSIELESST